MSLSLSADPAPFREGEDYTVLGRTHSDRPAINQFFSFYCPHCYQFGSLNSQIKQRFGDRVEFKRSHVSFMGGEMGYPMTKAYATMVLLNIEEKMSQVVFDQLHQIRVPPRNTTELRQLFLDNDIQEKAFDEAYHSFLVKSMAKSFDKEFQEAGLIGIPSIVVNNKYLTMPQSLKTIESYFSLLSFLLEK